MIEGNSHLKTNEMFDYRVDYLYEISRIRKAIIKLDGDHGEESKKTTTKLHEVLKDFSSTTDLMVSYLTGELYDVAVTLKESLSSSFRQQHYREYDSALKRFISLQNIATICLNLGPDKYQLFLDRYYKVKEKSISFDRERMFDYNFDYFGEIETINHAIKMLDKDNSVEARVYKEQLNSTLMYLTKITEKVTSYLTGGTYYHAIASKDNADQSYDEEKYGNYANELKCLDEYCVIGNICLKMTEEERQRFLNKYQIQNQKDLNDGKVR